MNLHNDTIVQNDRVYDLTRGDGLVLAVGNRTFTVEFGGGKQKSYNELGIASDSGRASLYWHDPVTVKPPKSNTEWQKQKDVFAAISAYFRT